MAAASGCVAGKDQAEPGAERNDEMSDLLPTLFAGFAKRRYKNKRRLIVAGQAGEGLTEYVPRTALDALLKEAREKALREAAVELECNWGHIATPEMRDAILALISEDATDG